MVLHKRFVQRLAVLTASTVMCMNVSTLQAKDYKGHWAQEAISEWTSLGIIQGYEDGTIRPSQPVTRAELAAMLSRVFKLNYKNESVNYKDVKENAWYYQAVELVMSAQLMNDYEDEFRPNQLATREEAAYALAHAYHLSGGEVKTFVDSNLISDWAQEEVEALIAGGYLQGRTDGTLAPQDVLTRADFVTMLDKLTAKLYQNSGTYTENVGGNVVINTSDVILKDMTISGNLYITEGVGEGEVTLENVKIDGNVIIEGGGENSIEIKQSTLKNIYVNKVSGPVRIALDQASKAANVQVNSEARLEGAIERLEVITQEEVKLVGASVKNLQVSVADGKIGVDKTSVIEQLVVDATATITGNGKVNKAFINADHVVLDGLKIAKDTITINSNVTVSPVIKTTSGQTSGGGGGGGSTAGSDKNESNNSGGTDSSDKEDSNNSGSTDDLEKPGHSVEVTGVHIIGDTKVTTGASIKLVADVETTADDESFKQVKWSIKSGSLEDVKITEDGVFTAGKTTGVATVVATSKQDDSKYAEHTINVINESEYIPVESITLNYEAAELSVGEGLQLSVDVKPFNATNKQVVWSSNNEKSVQVDRTGYVTAIHPGEAVITATTLDGKYSVACRIVVKESEQNPVVTGIRVTGDTTVEVGESIALRAEVTVSPNEEQYKGIIWQLKDGAPEGTVISESGILTAGRTEGSAIVIAMSKEDPSKYAEHYVTITKKIPVESITLEDKEMLLGDETLLTAEIFPVEATNKTLIWSSNNPSIVSVDASGKIVAKGIGEAKITASTLDGTVNAQATVKVNAGILKGRVITEEKTVERPQVLLYLGNRFVSKVNADENGNYEFSNLSKGNYSVYVLFGENETKEYVAPVSNVAVDETLENLDIQCEKVTSLVIKVVDSEVTSLPVQYVFVSIEGEDSEGNKWSDRQETNGAGYIKFILPDDIKPEITYTVTKDGYEEITEKCNVESLAKNKVTQSFKRSMKANYDHISPQAETEGDNTAGLGDTTYDALKEAGWRVESSTELSTNSRRLRFENLHGKKGYEGKDARIIYNRSGLGEEEKDFDALLQCMIRKQSSSTTGDLGFTDLKQTIVNGGGVHHDGSRTIEVTYDGNADGIVEIVFSNYTK